MPKNNEKMTDEQYAEILAGVDEEYLSIMAGIDFDEAAEILLNCDEIVAAEKRAKPKYLEGLRGTARSGKPPKHERSNSDTGKIGSLRRYK